MRGRGPGSCLFAEPLEPVCPLRASFALVRKLCDEQREWLGVPGGPKRSGVHRIETYVANQPSGDLLRAGVVAAVHQAGSVWVPAALEHAEQHFAGHGVECADNLSSTNLACKLLRAR